MKEQRYRETEPLKKGELVVMHTCVESRNPKYEGKIWTCKTDQFTRGECVYAQDSIFLEGFTGSFAPEFLQRVNVEPLLTEKDATINKMTQQLKTSDVIYERMKSAYFEQCKETGRLRKALEEVKPYLQSLQTDIPYESPSYLHNAVNLILHKINAALGEGDNT